VKENIVQALAIIDAMLNLKPSDLRFRREDPRAHTTSPGKNVDKQDLITGVSTILEASKSTITR
jgi:hypothetical protein